MPGIFDGIDLDSANSFKEKQTFVRFTKGEHVCEVVRTGAHRTYRGKIPLFIADLKVLSSADTALPQGTIVNYSDSPLEEWSLRRIRQLLIAAGGLQPGQADDDALIASTDWSSAIRGATNNPSLVAGAQIIVTGEEVKKKNGDPYVRVSFATTAANRAKRVALLSKKPAGK